MFFYNYHGFNDICIALTIILDAPLNENYIKEVIGPEDQSGIYREIMEEYDKSQCEDYLRRNPHRFSWKTIALKLYKCGKDQSLDKLFKFMHSPEGML